MSEFFIDQKLSVGSEDEISEVAARIESDTLVRDKPMKPDVTVVSDYGHTGYDPMVAMVINLTGGFYSDLMSFSKDCGVAELRSPLKAFINVLVDVYSQI